MAKSILAVLASASVFAPEQGLAEAAFENALYEPGQDEATFIKVRASAVTMTIYPGEDLGRRGDVGVTDSEYQFNLVVPVSYSGDGYRPYGGFQGRSDLDATLMHVYVPDTLKGIWYPNTSCLVREDMTSINWTTSSSSVTLSFHVDRAKFDAARANSSSPIVLKGWLEASSACPRAASSTPSTSSDDDK